MFNISSIISFFFKGIMNAKSAQIHEFILSGISAGEFSIGAKIPTEKELGERFSTNRMMAHYAVKRLEKDGVVVRNKKQGTLVNPRISDTAILDLRSLHSKRVYILATLSDSKGIHWNESVISTLEHNLQEMDYAVINQDFECEHASFIKQFAEIAKSGARAVFILPDHDEALFLQNNQNLLECESPDIYFLNRGVGSFHRTGCHILSFDSFNEGVIAGEYLRKKGYREIIFAGEYNDASHFWVEERMAGAAVGSQGSNKNTIPITELKLSGSPLIKRLRETIENSEEKPAIIAKNDSLAIQILEGLKKSGLSAPADFALIGFDNTPAGRKLGLTSVAPPANRVGDLFTEMMSQIKWRKSNGIKINMKVKSKIMERKTTPKRK